MSHPVIPAPARFSGGAGRFAWRPGTQVWCAAPGVAPIAGWFCAEVTRRTGVPVAAMAGRPGPGEPCVRIEPAGDELGELPAPVGVSPTGDDPPDERYSLAADVGQVVLRVTAPAGAARGLATLLQLVATAPRGGGGEILVPGVRILDAPRYAWRGLSLDVARAFFTPGEIRRVIDLLALYKLNVLHLHLTDDQGWRLPARRSAAGRPATGRPARAPGLDSTYRAEDLRALAAYAADRFVTVVPEVNTPGHAAALLRLHPELNTARNQAELAPGRTHHTGWLDPELPATFELIEQVLAGVAAIFPGPYIHIGGDEPHGMPRHLYSRHVRRVRRLVRSAGRRPLGWQETARAGLGAGDMIQYWLTGIARPASLPPGARARMDADLAASRTDADAAASASAPVIVSPQSHCYLDVPYAEPSADLAQAERQGRAGLRLYASMTVAESFGWEPEGTLGPGREAQVAGVEAAIWAETITGFDDLTFLLLPRLPGVAHKAWSGPHAAWADHRERLARHGPLWAQDSLTYFRTSAVDWPSEPAS